MKALFKHISRLLFVLVLFTGEASAHGGVPPSGSGSSFQVLGRDGLRAFHFDPSRATAQAAL